jgi:hypothetical protein
MKKQIAFIAALAAIATIFACVSAHAQTNTPATFFTSAQSYLTEFNTNYTFSGVKLEMSTGYKQVTGVNAASFVDGQYNFANGLNIDASIQFSGVGSAINGAEAGIGYNVIQHYDCEVNAVLLGGYDNVRGDGVIEPGVTLKKKLTENTFAEIGMSLPVFFQGGFNSQPTFRVGTGFTF